MVNLDLYVSLAALIVGFTIGLTGMGGGALMTPILVLLFRVPPLAAVSSDLVAAVVIKPVGAGVHIRQRTVNWAVVRWLALGSIPAAFLGVLMLKQLGSGRVVQERLKLALGVALLVAVTAMVIRTVVQAHRLRHQRDLAVAGLPPEHPRFVLRRLPTFLIGAVGGVIVGMTSVGSGSLIIIMLLVLYPALSMKQLVGTDLVQAIPLVASAALGHLLFGDFQLDVTASLLIGSIPGVYIGARVSSRAPDAVVRPALVLVLLASALKLLGASTLLTGQLVLAFVLVGLPVWGVIDALAHPWHHWAWAGLSRARWVRVQAIGAPVGIGFGAAIAYFLRVRPRLAVAQGRGLVSLWGDELPLG